MSAPHLIYEDGTILSPGDLYQTRWTGAPYIERSMLIAEEKATQKDHPYGSGAEVTMFYVMDIVTGKTMPFSSSHSITVNRVL